MGGVGPKIEQTLSDPAEPWGFFGNFCIYKMFLLYYNLQYVIV